MAPWLATTVGVTLLMAIVQVMLTFGLMNPNFSYANFAQYFTIQSNILCSLFFLYRWSPALRRRPMHDRTYDYVRGGLVLFMSQTTFVYWAVLQNLFVIPDSLTYATIAYLHSGAFIFLLIDYAVQPPKTQVSVSQAISWLAYPLLYAAWIYAAAPFRGWYPYPFMDPVKSGSVSAVIINNAVLLVIMGAVAMGVRWLHNAWFRRLY